MTQPCQLHGHGQSAHGKWLYLLEIEERRDVTLGHSVLFQQARDKVSRAMQTVNSVSSERLRAVNVKRRSKRKTPVALRG